MIPIGNVQLFVNLLFILYARWRFKIVCLQTKLASLAIRKNLISIDFQLQFSINVARFARRNLVSMDFELQFPANVARFAHKNLISIDFQL